MQFDFQLSAVQEERASRLHRESIVIDLLSQHAGGNIFSSYPAELQRDFRACIAAAGPGYDAMIEATYWPYEMAKQSRSELIRGWLQGSGLTCGVYDLPVHDGRGPSLNRWEELVARYTHLPWMRYVTTAADIRQAKRDGVLAFYAF